MIQVALPIAELVEPEHNDRFGYPSLPTAHHPVDAPRALIGRLPQAAPAGPAHTGRRARWDAVAFWFWTGLTLTLFVAVPVIGLIEILTGR